MQPAIVAALLAVVLLTTCNLRGAVGQKLSNAPFAAAAAPTAAAPSPAALLAPLDPRCASFAHSRYIRVRSFAASHCVSFDWLSAHKLYRMSSLCQATTTQELIVSATAAAALLPPPLKSHLRLHHLTYPPPHTHVTNKNNTPMHISLRMHCSMQRQVT